MLEPTAEIAAKTTSDGRLSEQVLAPSPPKDAAMEGGASNQLYSRTVLVLSGSGFAASVNLRSMDTILPKLSEDFGVTIGQASFVITAYAVGYGTCQLAVGLLGDRLGKVRLIVMLCLFSAVATALSSFAGSISELAAARMLAGVAASGIVPLAMAWIGDHIPMGDRQSVMARYMSGTIAGGLLGQVIGGILAEAFGWRTTTLVFALGFVLVAAALMRESRHVLPTPKSDGSALLALRGSISALRGNGYAFTVLAGVVIEGIAIFSVLSFAGASLHARFGLSLGWIGALLACFALGGLIYSFVVRRLLKRFRPLSLVRAGGPVAAAGLLVLGFSPYLWSIPVAITMMGFGFYLVHNPLQVHATQFLPGARGTGVAMFATALFLSQSIGVALVAPVVDRWGLWPVCLSAAAAMQIAGVWLSIRLRQR